jgi:hypothetical protein
MEANLRQNVLEEYGEIRKSLKISGKSKDGGGLLF